MPFPKGRGQARQLGGIEGLLPPPPRVHAVEKKWGILLKKIIYKGKINIQSGSNPRRKPFFGGFPVKYLKCPPP